MLNVHRRRTMGYLFFFSKSLQQINSFFFCVHFSMCFHMEHELRYMLAYEMEFFVGNIWMQRSYNDEWRKESHFRFFVCVSCFALSLSLFSSRSQTHTNAPNMIMEKELCRRLSVSIHFIDILDSMYRVQAACGTNFTFH